MEKSCWIRERVQGY